MAKALVYPVRSDFVAGVLEAIWTREFSVVLGRRPPAYSSSTLAGEFTVGQHDSSLDSECSNYCGLLISLSG